MRMFCTLPAAARRETAEATDQWISAERQQSATLLVLHEPHRRVRRCLMCHRRLDTEDSMSLDCGGDCLGCILQCEADAGRMISPVLPSDTIQPRALAAAR